MMSSRLIQYLLWTQGIYYLLTAVWPLVHIESFMVVTGRKQDIWLVKTVSVLILSVALALLYGIYYHTDYRLVRLIAVSSALGLTAIDIWYYLQGVIKWVYLADAVAEVALIVGWCVPKIPRGQVASERSH